MAKRKFSRKELKQPDEFVTFSAKAWNFIRDNKMPLILGGSALLAVVLIFGIYSSYTSSTNLSASKLLVHALKVYDQEVVPMSSEEGKGEDQKAPEGKKEPSKDEIPVFNTQKEKNEAALKAFQEVSDKHGGGVALLARLNQAGLFLEMGEHDKAVEMYQGLINEVDDEALKSLALESLGMAHEEKKDLAKAKEVYQRLADGSLEFYRPRGAFALARVLEREGAKDKAKEAYNKLLQDYPETELKGLVQTRVNILETE